MFFQISPQKKQKKIFHFFFHLLKAKAKVFYIKYILKLKSEKFCYYKAPKLAKILKKSKNQLWRHKMTSSCYEVIKLCQVKGIANTKILWKFEVNCFTISKNIQLWFFLKLVGGYQISRWVPKKCHKFCSRHGINLKFSQNV